MPAAEKGWLLLTLRPSFRIQPRIYLKGTFKYERDTLKKEDKNLFLDSNANLPVLKRGNRACLEPKGTLFGKVPALGSPKGSGCRGRLCGPGTP